MRVEEGFQIPVFPEGNPYNDDLVLPSLLARLFDESTLKNEVAPDLERLGGEVMTTIRHLSTLAEPPRLMQYNHWGQRIDTLHTSEGWRELKKVAQREGVIAIPYERKYGELSRVYGLAKVLLMTGDSQTIMCPISMTDGCARVMELLGTEEMKRGILPRLTSRDPVYAFTSGQWMTERPGGSDISQTETVAKPQDTSNGAPGALYTLDGFKWFSSATDSNVSLALARTGPISAGSRSLSLFLVPLRLPLLPPSGAPDAQSPSTSNGIYVHRLKQKFGTQIVPTAELSLTHTQAYLLSPLNAGVKSITPVLNITRLYSAVTSLGSLRRALSIARAYATVRTVDGGARLLRDAPAHVAELGRVAMTYRAVGHLVFGTVRLLGKAECGVASGEEEARLRMLTPACKAFAADQCVAAMEECMSALGGMGYMEEVGIGRLIRDTLVEKIWEGTITVLSLDLVRATRNPDTIQATIKWADFIIDTLPLDLMKTLSEPLALLRASLSDLQAMYSSRRLNEPLASRPALFLFSHACAALFLLEHAAWSHPHSGSQSSSKDPFLIPATAALDADVFVRWVLEGGMDSARRDLAQARALGSQVERLEGDVRVVYGVDLARPKL